MVKDNKVCYSIYADLKQLEKELDWTPTDLIRSILSLGTVEYCKLDIGRQEIVDGNVVNHPVIDCRFATSEKESRVHEVLSPDYFVIDKIVAKKPKKKKRILLKPSAKSISWWASFY